METNTNRSPLLVSKKETAALLGVCPRTVDYLLAGKQLTGLRIGKRLLIKYASVIAFTKGDHAASPSKCAVEVR